MYALEVKEKSISGLFVKRIGFLGLVWIWEEVVGSFTKLGFFFWIDFTMTMHGENNQEIK